MTDEGCDQRLTLLSRLSYVPADSSGDGGTRTHNPRISNHVLQSAVGHILVATKVVVRGFTELPRIWRSWAGIGPATSRTVACALTMYSKPAVAVVFNAQRRVAKSCFSYGRPYQQRESLIVDWPLCLRETSAPFVSRSPGITTFGPSCTPSRQLGSVLYIVKGPTKWASRHRASWHTFTGC